MQLLKSDIFFSASHLEESSFYEVLVFRPLSLCPGLWNRTEARRIVAEEDELRRLLHTISAREVVRNQILGISTPGKVSHISYRQNYP